MDIVRGAYPLVRDLRGWVGNLATMLASVVLSVLLMGSTQTLKVGNDFYLSAPPVRLTGWLSNPSFSRDSQYLAFIDERVEGNYASEKARVAQGRTDKNAAIVRFDVRRGVRETLYTPSKDETLMGIEPVGSSGDVLIRLAVGVPEGDNLNWRCLFAPVGGRPRLVADGVKSRSFQVAASRTERRAFVLVCGLGAPASYLFITEEQTVTKPLPVTGFQGIFGYRTPSGNPVAAIQGPAPDYRLLGQFELDFRTGESRPAGGAAEVEVEVEVEELPVPLIEYDDALRSAGDEALGQLPLRDVLARATGSAPAARKVAFAQGVLASLETSPNGLVSVYVTAEGYFLKEWVKADATLTKKLREKPQKT